jgi:predicted XRE-type DNA-binding protein
VDWLILKKVKFPSKKELTRVLKKLEKTEGSLVLSPDATSHEKLRYDICKQFVIYKREHKLQVEDLAKKVGINESQMCKVLRYSHQRFTTDKLIDVLSKIHPKYSIEILIF